MVNPQPHAVLASDHFRARSALTSSQLARQLRSCKVCRFRKVKCDRVQPCHACCAHGYPSKCAYDTDPDDNLQPISQTDEIRNLRHEIRELTATLNSRQRRARKPRRLAQLQALFDAIRSAPLDVTNRIVADVRRTRGRTHGEAFPLEPENGSEGAVTTRPRGSHDPDGRIDEDEADYRSGRHASSRSSSEDSEDSSYGAVCHLGSSKPMLDVFIERFVDAFSPQVSTKAGQAGAVRRAAGIRMFSPILMDAFESVSTAYFGRIIQDKDLEASGFRLYPRVLRSLQQALQDPERSKAESTLVTVMLLMAFESVERTTQGSLLAHVHGAMRLIEHRGPENHVHGVEHLLYTELRPFWVSASFITRRPCFLAAEEWINLPWSANTSKRDILHYLLDLAVEVPALLGQFDDVQATLGSNLSSVHEITVKQVALWDGVADLTERFRRWKVQWVDSYPDGPPQEVEVVPSDQFPLFQCRDFRTGGVMTPTTFVYPDLRLAQTMCLYYSIRLVLSSVDTRPEGRVGPLDQYAMGCGICRSLEWYIQNAAGNMINRLVFPVRVAWEIFPDAGPERRYLQEVLKLVEKRHSLALWGGGMSELSPRAGSPQEESPDMVQVQAQEG
ncbi:C6 finger domain-containing protein [Aspergillus heteromorphus CBS 117.55]|uniref:C6 finger domain-containing protein n=1 Tax=Aspergillus heteromorphus CBS 117.55 TaxID=1448321 RepID=A0A317WMZ6_9EURO|nr:C6 finger domain-containing protein [Aspergillus heteromorphus CBS 117.55]PWY86652.1 C6 finger domain-containing protein [Aspergillus heteromorphus CBS 117.55]